MNMNETLTKLFAEMCKPMTDEEADELREAATGEPFFILYTREEKLQALCSLGILTPKEAEAYKEAPAELPADKKALIVNYFLLNIYDEKKTVYREPFSELLASIPYRIIPGSVADVKNMSFLDRYDIGKAEALERFAGRSIEYYYRCAQTFVGAYRNRFRAYLMPYMRMEVAAALSEGEPKAGEMNPAPVLWDIVKEAGYRDKAKSLNETDRAAIDKAATYFLNVIELGFLNGELVKAEQRKENAPTSEGVLTENFYYENEYDEALWNYEVVECIFLGALYEALNGGDALPEIKKSLKRIYFGIGLREKKDEEEWKELTKDFLTIVTRLRNNPRFKSYVTEAEQC